MNRLRTHRIEVTIGLIWLGGLWLGIDSAFAQRTQSDPEDDKTVLAGSIITTQNEVKDATRELNELRDRISEAKMPLARELGDREASVAKLRERARQLRAARQLGEQAHEVLRRDVQSLQDECQFIYSVLGEYRRSMETRAPMAEALRLKTDLAAIDLKLNDKDNYASVSQSAAQLLTLAAGWNRQRLGGSLFEGICLDEKGVAHEGRFAVLGPASYFHSTKGDMTGIAITRIGSSLPSLFPDLDPSEKRAIADLVAGKESFVPVDVTSGDALKVKASRPSLAEHIKSGGIVMIPILAVGLIAIVLSVMKITQLSRMRIADPSLIDKAITLIAGGETDDALVVVERMREPLARLLREGINHITAPKEHIEEILYEHMLGCMPALDRHLGTLAVLGGVAPLLGLLGTVTGIIHTFQVVTLFGTGDPRMFSAGISEALVTTKFGLGIAIPILLVHAYLSRRVRNLVSAMEHTVAMFVNELFHKGDA